MSLDTLLKSFDSDVISRIITSHTDFIKQLEKQRYSTKETKDERLWKLYEIGSRIGGAAAVADRIKIDKPKHDAVFAACLAVAGQYDEEIYESAYGRVRFPDERTAMMIAGSIVRDIAAFSMDMDSYKHRVRKYARESDNIEFAMDASWHPIRNGEKNHFDGFGEHLLINLVKKNVITPIYRIYPAIGDHDEDLRLVLCSRYAKTGTSDPL